jgi:gamma-glutamyl phosphate reductase
LIKYSKAQTNIRQRSKRKKAHGFFGKRSHRTGTKNGQKIIRKGKQKMARIPVEERVESINKKLHELRAQRQKLLNTNKQKQKKERTRRLIQLATITEQALKWKDIEPEIYRQIMSLVANYHPVVTFINSYKMELGKRATHTIVDMEE